MRSETLRPEWVDLAPAQLTPGVLYISRKYGCAVHLCCCGCGEKVVTPLSPAEWSLTTRGNAVSLHPSIGNVGMPCRSHYWIRHSRVVWTPRLTPEQGRAVMQRDLHDLIAQQTLPRGLWGRLLDRLRRWF